MEHEPPLEIDEGECLYFPPEEFSEPPMFNAIGIDAGEKLTLHNADQSLDLVRFIENGSVLYHVPSCGPDTFPFGSLFSLTVPGSESEDGIPGFELENAILVHERVSLLTTTTDAESISSGQNYNLSWSKEDFTAEVQPFVLEETKTFILENQVEESPDGSIEYLECNPLDDGLTVQEADIAQLQAQIKSITSIQWGVIAQSVELPWGESFGSYTSYGIRGEMVWE